MKYSYLQVAVGSFESIWFCTLFLEDLDGASSLYARAGSWQMLGILGFSEVPGSVPCCCHLMAWQQNAELQKQEVLALANLCLVPH